jgi:hypothetical protein
VEGVLALRGFTGVGVVFWWLAAAVATASAVSGAGPSRLCWYGSFPPPRPPTADSVVFGFA